VCPIKARPTRCRMGCNRVRRLRDARANGVTDGMMVRERWWLRALRRPHVFRLIGTARSHGGIADALARWVRWMIEQGTNVVHEQWVEQLGDLLLVCEVQRTIEWYPTTVLAQRHSSSVGVPPYQTPLRCIGPILTTCLVFSLFKIPSRRPRVIPATFSSLVPLIMWLSSRLATQTLLASTWKHRLPSSSHSVAVTLGFIPGGATCPVVSQLRSKFCCGGPGGACPLEAIVGRGSDCGIPPMEVTGCPADIGAIVPGYEYPYPVGA